MAYVIEINKRDLSDSAEECNWKNEEGHNADGTGPECDEMCKSTDGDPREVRTHSTGTYEYDESDKEEHGSPIEWAASWLGGSDFPDLYAPRCHNGKAGEDQWLIASEEHPYLDEYTEYSICLRGDWTDEGRAAVFKRVGA